MLGTHISMLCSESGCVVQHEKYKHDTGAEVSSNCFQQAGLVSYAQGVTYQQVAQKCCERQTVTNSRHVTGVHKLVA